MLDLAAEKEHRSTKKRVEITMMTAVYLEYGHPHPLGYDHHHLVTESLPDTLLRGKEHGSEMKADG